MVRRKKGFWLLAVLVCLCFLGGCQRAQKEDVKKDGEFFIYYLNSEENKLIPETYEAKETGRIALAEELLQAMDDSPKDLSLRKIKPEEVFVSDIEDMNKNGQLTVNYSSSYKKMKTVQEVLYRAAVVKTLTQIEGVEFVQFYVEGQPLTDRNEKVIGFMSEDMFIDNTGKETNYYQNVSMVLYFADRSGTKLKETHVTKVYDGTVAMEQLVIQQLLAGVNSINGLQAGYYDTIPEGTALIKTTTKDGICYVDFNSAFLNKRKGLSDKAAVYSVVNSLVELPSVSKVQFTIDGLSVEKYGDGLVFNDFFERDLDIVE